MRFREDLTVGRPAADVWALIEDGTAFACVPGLRTTGPGTGTMKVNLAELPLTFEGEGTVRMDAAARTARIEVRAVERAGRGRLRLMLSLTVEEDGLFSAVQVEAEVVPSGAMGDLARTGLLTEAVHRLADEFADRLEARLVASGPPATAAPVSPDRTETAPGWLARLIGRFRRS